MSSSAESRPGGRDLAATVPGAGVVDEALRRRRVEGAGARNAAAASSFDPRYCATMLEL